MHGELIPFGDKFTGTSGATRRLSIPHRESSKSKTALPDTQHGRAGKHQDHRQRQRVVQPDAGFSVDSDGIEQVVEACSISPRISWVSARLASPPDITVAVGELQNFLGPGASGFRVAAHGMQGGNVDGRKHIAIALFKTELVPTDGFLQMLGASFTRTIFP